MRGAVSLPHRLDQAGEPFEYQPQLTPERCYHDGYDTSDTFSEDGGVSESESTKSSLPDKCESGKARRKRSLYPASVRSDDIQSSLSDQSPANSVTSLNSISSLLREKLMMSFPRGLKKRKAPKEYKLRSFVAILFLAIVLLVSFAHYYYHQHVLQRAYFDKIRFNKDDRIVKLFNSEGWETARGYLGVGLSPVEKVYECLAGDEMEGHVCLEWMHQARLYLSYEERNNIRCYGFTWISLDPETTLTDCFDNAGTYGHWYGGGRTLGMAWPVELGKVEMSAFVTGYIGKHRWGSVLKRYFINSQGVAIFIDQQTPLYVSINAEERARLCLQARHDDFAYVTHMGLPKLNYSVCSSDNMKDLHWFLSEKSLWDGLREADIDTINYLLREPVWQIAPASKAQLTESAVLNYTDDVIALGFIGQGHVLLNEHWQAEGGDFTFDPKRFPTMDKTIEIIQRRGFRIALTVQPFIGTESSNFASVVKQGLLIKERGVGERSQGVAALTRYKSLESAGMIDITNNQSVSWVQAHLTNLSHKYQIDSFYLDMGTAYDMPYFYQLNQTLTNPDHFKTLFTRHLVNQVCVMGVSGAVEAPKAPAFVSLPLLPSTWRSLQIIIPTILTYGIVGYPFLMPGPVGGDYCLHDAHHDQGPTYKGLSDGPTKNGGNVSELSIGDLRLECDLPEKELYTRWLQLATFLPVIRYSNLPSDYGDPALLEQAKLFTALRERKVSPLLRKYAEEALNSGLPLIRPLWMLDPSDTTCHVVKDEFSVGEALIVAPILKPAETEREVYLPAGVWKDGIDSSLRKGSRWLHSYHVPLDKIAYFEKMPDNTRF